MSPGRLSDLDYARLLAARTDMRRFLHWSEQQAAAAGLTAAQHQLLLAIRGHLDPRGPTIGEIADSLLLRHHSAVGLVDRAVAVGLVERHHADEDRRVVRCQLTKTGALALETLSELHLAELRRLGGTLQALSEGLGSDRPGSDRPGGASATPLVPE
jgi:DNA-binding MarR family transcriptional regulator